MIITFSPITAPLKEANTYRTPIHLAPCMQGSSISSFKYHNHSPNSDEEQRVRKVKGGSYHAASEWQNWTIHPTCYPMHYPPSHTSTMPPGKVTAGTPVLLQPHFYNKNCSTVYTSFWSWKRHPNLFSFSTVYTSFWSWKKHPHLFSYCLFFLSRKDDWPWSPSSPPCWASPVQVSQHPGRSRVGALTVRYLFCSLSQTSGRSPAPPLSSFQVSPPETHLLPSKPGVIFDSFHLSPSQPKHPPRMQRLYLQTLSPHLHCHHLSSGHLTTHLDDYSSHLAGGLAQTLMPLWSFSKTPVCLETHAWHVWLDITARAVHVLISEAVTRLPYRILQMWLN